MIDKIKFGTDGWRAIIAKDFTVNNVARVAEATAEWLLKKSKNAIVVLGYDCRFGGKLFCETIAKILCSRGIKVYHAENFVSTPMISLGTVNYKADIGIIITASHNPPDYNGFKLKGSYGGPLLPDQVSEIESLIPDETTFSNLETYSLASLDMKTSLDCFVFVIIPGNLIKTGFILKLKSLLRSCRASPIRIPLDKSVK